MENIKAIHKTFVQVTAEVLQKSSDANDINIDLASCDLDCLTFIKNLDILSSKYPVIEHSPISPEHVLDLIKLMPCAELSFVEACLFGNVKSVYNQLKKKSEQAAAQYLADVTTYARWCQTKNKFAKTISGMKIETKKIEDDLEIVAGIISSLTSEKIPTKEEKNTRINNIIKIADKLWSDKDYAIKLINAVQPSMLENPESNSKITKLVEHLYVDPESIETFLEHITLWTHPDKVTKRMEVIDAVKTIFKRSRVLRTWKKDKSDTYVKERIKKVSVGLNILFDLFLYNKADFIGMFKILERIAKEKYNISRPGKSMEGYKQIISESLAIGKSMKQEIRQENKNRVLAAINNLWVHAVEYTNITTLIEAAKKMGYTYNLDSIKEFIVESFPLSVVDGEKGFYDILVEECVSEKIRFFMEDRVSV